MRRYSVIKMLLCIVVMLTISGCATLYAPPSDPLCGRPEYAGSVICAIGAKVNMSPEQMDGMLLDATLLPVAVKQVQAADMKKAIAKVRKWVVEKDVLTMEGISAYLYEQAAIDPALGLLISRRLPMFANVPDLSIKPFLACDKQLVVMQLDHQDAQFKFLK
jgi:hypothetical protein